MRSSPQVKASLAVKKARMRKSSVRRRPHGTGQPGATANYLAADCLDIMYATKEKCRGMARPTKMHWYKLKRLGHYLVGSGRTVMNYKWQGHVSKVKGYTDAEWAGCRVTRKSTSGGALMIREHFIKGWPQTQNHVTMRCAEAR